MKKFLAILLSVVMLLGCVVISTAAAEITYPETAYAVSATGMDIISAVENANWYDVHGASDSASISVGSNKLGSILNDCRPDDTFAYTVNIETAGEYELAMAYIWQWEFEFSVTIDDGEAIKMPVLDFYDWNTVVICSPVKVNLSAGEHTIKVTHATAGSGCHFFGIVLSGDGSISDYLNTLHRSTDELSPNTPINVAGNDSQTFGYRFNAKAAFEKASLWMPTWGNTNSTCTISLYAWDTDVATTTNGTPVATKELNPMGGDAWQSLTFEAQHAGEYLFYVSGATGGCGVYLHKKDGVSDKGYVYIGTNEPVNDTLTCFEIVTTAPYEGDVFDQVDLNGTPETPVEPEYPADQTVSLDKVLVLPATQYAKTNATAAHIAAAPGGFGTVYSAHSTDENNLFYFEYEVYVEESGWYRLSVGALWPDSATQILYTVDGEDYAIQNTNNSGGLWNTVFATSPITMTLSEGKHTIRTTLTYNAVGQIYSLNVVPATDGMAPALPTSVQYAGDNAWQDVSAGYGYRFSSNGAFSAFVMTFTTGGDATVSLYKWNYNYDVTVKGTPIATKSFTGISHGASIGLTLDEVATAGEYLIVVSNATAGLGVTAHTMVPEDTYTRQGFAYIGGIEVAQDASVVIDFESANSYNKADLFNVCAPQIGYDQSPVVGGAEFLFSIDYYNVWDSYALHIAPNTSFDSLKIFMATYEKTDMHAIFSLYKWDCCYDCTVRGNALATQDKLLADNSFQTFDFDAQPAGEYLLVINGVYFTADGSGAPLVCSYKTNTSFEGDVYCGGALVDNPYAPEVYLHFTEIVDDFYAEPTADAADVAYVYVNSLDGEIVHSGNAPIGEPDADTLAKLNAYANEDYNSFVKFEEVSYKNHVYTFYSVHNTEATVTVNGEAVAPAEGGVYYMLTADAPAEGEYFLGWYDGDKLISYNETYKFFPDGATESLVAKYAEEAPAKDSKVEVEADRTSDKLTVKVTPVYGDDVEIINFGYYVATSAEPMTADEVITNGQKLDSEAPHVYMVRVHDLLETTKAQNIYIVGYFTYNDGEAIKTKPTAVIVVEVPNA